MDGPTRWRPSRSIGATPRSRAGPRRNPHGGNLHRLDDAEWIERERDLADLEDAAGKLAHALRGVWPTLEAALGGGEACVADIVAAHFPAVQGVERGWISPPGPDAKADPADPDLPPPADEAYDAATYELRRACRDVTQCYAQELASARASLASRPALLAWARRVDGFRDLVATLDDAAGSISWSDDPRPWFAVPRPCPYCTSVLLTARVLRLLGASDGAGLAAHLVARGAWGRAAMVGLVAVRTSFAGPCASSESRPRDCAPAWAALRPRAIAAIDAALARGKALGAELCDAAPELRAALGERCGATAAAYLFAFSGSLGSRNRLR